MKIVRQKTSGPSKVAADKMSPHLLRTPPFVLFEKQERLKEIEQKNYHRRDLAKILTDYNKRLGADKKTLQNIDKLKKKGSYCVVAGQQLGLMGGPSYTVLKAITCLLMAKEFDAIPVFWLASEDHDISEIDHTYLVDCSGNLKEYRLRFGGHPRFIEDLEIGPHNKKVIDDFCQAVGIDEKVLDSSNFSEVMARQFLKNFEGTGLVVVEPRLLRPLSQEFFRKEILFAKDINKILQDTTKKMSDAKKKTPLEVGEGTHLFMKVDGSLRKRIVLSKTKDTFVVDKTRYSQKELLELIEKSPELFSPDALARPVLQSLLFPTLSCVLGPTENAYYHQLIDYHKFHEVDIPLVTARISATLIPPYAGALLEKTGLKPDGPIPKRWVGAFAGLQQEVEALKKEWEAAADAHFGETISSLSLGRDIKRAARNIEKKVWRAILAKKGIPYDALHYLNNLLNPHNTLQERVLNWWEFQSNAEEDLVKALLQQLSWNEQEHIYCYF